jgi:hypothetical protein
MRLALMIQNLGATPVPFEHIDFISYKKDLKEQYRQLRLQVGPELARRVQRDVEAIRSGASLSAAAGQLVPLYPFTPERTIPNNRLRRQCRWKLVHTNFLSALHHAHQLAKTRGETNLRIYPCLVCNGIHIGHGKKGNWRTPKNEQYFTPFADNP